MIREIEGNAAKLIWLWIAVQGKTTPAEICRECGMSRAVVMAKLGELRSNGKIQSTARGLYCIAGNTQSLADKAQRLADRTESLADKTCLAGKTTECPADKTECLADKTPDAQRNISERNKIKEKKDFLSEKSTENLFEHVDGTSERFIELRLAAKKVFGERGVSPDLLDRIAAAVMLGLAGADNATLLQIKAESFEAIQAERVKHRWVHVASCIRQIFEAAGWTWTKCRTEREKQLQELNRVRAAKRAAEELAAATKEPDPPPTLNGAKVRKTTQRGTGPAAPIAEDALAKLGRRVNRKTG